MEGLWAAYAAAFTLGGAHALEVDHMVAVSAFIGGRPRRRAAVAFGLRWGLGHALVVLCVGGLLVWSGVAVPEAVTVWAELGVGVMLIALGVWALRAARRMHLHDPRAHGGHAHLHSHPPGSHPHDHGHRNPFRRHRHLSTLVGAAHGLAGTAPVVALVPVTMISDLGFALVYLLMFGVGTVLAMSLYAVIAVTALSKAASSVTTARRMAVVTATASLGVGLWWVVRAGTHLAR